MGESFVMIFGLLLSFQFLKSVRNNKGERGVLLLIMVSSNHTRVYVNEVTSRKLLRMGPGCQGSHPGA